MDKKQVAEQILKTGGSLYVIFKPREAIVPRGMEGADSLVFQYGNNMPRPIPDLYVNYDGIHASLSFQNKEIYTFVPWGAITAMHDDKYDGHIWETLPVNPKNLTPRLPSNKRPALRLVASNGKLL